MSTQRKLILAATGAIAATLLLFEVSFDPRFSLPSERRVADPAREQEYLNCIEESRNAALQDAYDETDNPAVHSTYARIAETEAARECRRKYPELITTESRPLEFNLIDLRYRY